MCKQPITATLGTVFFLSEKILLIFTKNIYLKRKKKKKECKGIYNGIYIIFLKETRTTIKSE
jgi:penicillin-binding protein-related factor A (putative recombinase)